MALTPSQMQELENLVVNLSPGFRQMTRELANTGVGFQEIKREIEVYKRGMGTLSDSLRESGRVIGRHTKKQEENIKKADKTAEAFQQLSAATRKAQEEVAASGAATAETMQAYNNALEDIRQTTGNVDQEFEQLGRTLETGGANLQSNLTRLGATISQQADARLQDAERMQRSNIPMVLDNMSIAGKKYITELGSVGNILRSFAGIIDAAGARVEDIRTAIKHSTGAFTVLPGVANSMYTLSQQTGMTTKEMQSLDIAGRQALNAIALESDARINLSDRAAVLNKSLGFLGSEFVNAGRIVPGLSKEFYNLTGSYEEGNKLLLNMMNNMRSVGMKTTGLEFQQAADDMATELKVASMITGQSATQLQGYINDQMEDHDIKRQLLLLDEKDRKQTIKRMYTEMTHQAALGKLNESTIAASKALAALKGQGAVSRYKAGANAQMMMSALGISGGAEFARLIAKPKSDLSETELRFVEEKSKEIKAAGREKQKGGLGGGENLWDVVWGAQDSAVQKLIDTNDNIAESGKDIGEQQLEVLRAQAATVDKNTAHLDPIDQKIWAANDVYERHLRPLAQDTKLGIVQALFTTSASIVAAIIGQGSLFSGGSPGGRGGRDPMGAITNPGGRGRNAGRLLRAGGKALLKKLPIIGAVTGLGYAASRAMQGDWVGAGGEAASGLASTIPGVGTAASVGIDAAMAARDAKREEETTQKEQESNMQKETSVENSTDMLEIVQEIRDILKTGNKVTEGVKKSIDTQTAVQKEGVDKELDAQKDFTRKANMRYTLADSDVNVSR